MDFKNNTKISGHNRLSVRKSFFVSVLIFTILLTPTLSQASILSFFGEMFSGQEVSAEAETYIDSTSPQTMPLLMAANTTDPSPTIVSDAIIVNNEALLPEVGPSNDAPEKAVISSDQISVYIVRSGDSLAKIAEMFDVSTNTILWANDLTKGSALQVGQTLIILPMSGVLHTVVKGDTLNIIAKKYGGDIEEIALFNDLKISDKLIVGQEVMIPDGQVSSSIRPSVSSSGASKLIKGSNNAPDYGGYYQKPFVGGTKTQGLHGYNAVDYGMPVGTPLYAAADGTVLISKNSGWNGGYGDYVAIKHPNNTQTIYGHMNKTVVLVGQTVTKGQLIGYSGNTGNSTGPHLHFEIRGAKNPF